LRSKAFQHFYAKQKTPGYAGRIEAYSFKKVF
jgi:hypothetical protein